MTGRQNTDSVAITDISCKIEKLEERKEVLKARYRQEKSRHGYEERKARAHRLIGIGAEVESVHNRQIRKEELPDFREYMKKAVKVLGAF